jgi:hypothetical protein
VVLLWSIDVSSDSCSANSEEIGHESWTWRGVVVQETNKRSAKRAQQKQKKKKAGNFRNNQPPSVILRPKVGGFGAGPKEPKVESTKRGEKKNSNTKTNPSGCKQKMLIFFFFFFTLRKSFLFLPCFAPSFSSLWSSLSASLSPLL